MDQDDDIRAYNILLKRHINDDRLMAERMSLFFLASSFLFVGFVTLLDIGGICSLRVAVPSIGIILCFLAFVAGERTRRGLDFWDRGEKKIEEEGKSFAYMRDEEIAPHLVYENVKKGTTGWLVGHVRNRYIYPYCIPFLFLILWAISLGWVLV